MDNRTKKNFFSCRVSAVSKRKKQSNEEDGESQLGWRTVTTIGVHNDVRDSFHLGVAQGTSVQRQYHRRSRIGSLRFRRRQTNSIHRRFAQVSFMSLTPLQIL